MTQLPKSARVAIFAGIFLLLVGAVGAAGFFYYKYQEVKKNPELVSKEEVATVTKALQRFIDLPTDEEPTVATVTDREKLKDQEFFRNSQNGDKILIYVKARKAILYRPSANRIIDFAPLTLDSTPAQNAVQQDSQTQAAPVKVTVSILNGSAVNGLAADVEERLKGIATIEVTEKGSTQKKDYSKNYVVDLSGKNAELAAQIAQTLNGEVGTLPDGEKRPNADLVILAVK
jgi:hypothetical protein